MAQTGGGPLVSQPDDRVELDEATDRGKGRRDAGRLLASTLSICLGYGAYLSCFCGGPVGMGCLSAGMGAWQGVAVAQLLGLLATAVMTLVYRRMSWETQSFPHAVIRRLSYLAGFVCVLLGTLVVGADAANELFCVLSAGFGIAMAYPLLAWFENLLIVYRRSGRSRCLLTVLGSELVCALLGILLLIDGGDAVGTGFVAILMVVASWALMERVANPETSVFAVRHRRGRRGPYRISKYSVVVVVSFGVTWGLASCLMAEVTFSSAGGAAVWMSIVASIATCIGAAVPFGGRLADQLHFGLIIRASIAIAGSTWVLVPVVAAWAPDALGAACAVVYVLQGSAMTFFSIEVAREYGLSIASVMPVNYAVFVLAACLAGVAFCLVRTQVEGHLSWDLVTVLAVAASLMATPMLPSRASDASMFTLEALPENEGYDDRIERARSTFAAKYGLTPREEDVLELLVEGRTREQIADGLSISTWTVKDHVSKIYRKVGVHSAKELMRLVAGAGQ